MKSAQKPQILLVKILKIEYLSISITLFLY